MGEGGVTRCLEDRHLKFYGTLELEVPESSFNLPNIVIMKSQKTKQISLLVALTVPYGTCNGHCESDLPVLECHIIFS